METADASTRRRAGLDRGLALILIGDVDRRVVPALLLAARLPELDAVAIHVAIDPDATHALANSWMELDMAWVPLRIEGPLEDEAFLDCVQRMVEKEAAERSRVLVIVPELDLDRWWQTLLHRSTGRRIARLLHGNSRVSTLVLPFPL